jgi:transcriptional regulator with XRE-family HTH domain
MKICRIRLGLTQYQLGQKTGIHPSRLSEMETGKREITDAVVRILEESVPSPEGGFIDELGGLRHDHQIARMNDAAPREA